MRHRQPDYGRWGVGYIVQQVFLLGLGIVMGQDISTWDPVDTGCNIIQARGIDLGDRMYVDGGMIINQQYYLLGIDKPYNFWTMIPWQSEPPSDQCPTY